MTTQYAADNKVIYFSVDGSAVEKRRQVVDIAKCNTCHVRLALHGENRNQTEYCVFCHNPANYTNASATAASQPINFSVMVHRIHYGENGSPYVIGRDRFRGDALPGVLAERPAGRYDELRDVPRQRVGGGVPGREAAGQLPGGLMDPAPATTAACTACHQSQVGDGARGGADRPRRTAKAATSATGRRRVQRLEGAREVGSGGLE